MSDFDREFTRISNRIDKAHRVMFWLLPVWFAVCASFIGFLCWVIYRVVIHFF